MDNSVFKAIIRSNDFRKLDTTHKYAILWASKFYRLINRLMRSKSFDEITSGYPYATRYICKFLKYFDQYGKNKQELIKNNIKSLYRGLTADFTLSQNITENGFMSTTYIKAIAERFSERNGHILLFDVSKLPDNVKYVTIDEEIDENFHEFEILFPPGMITIEKYPNCIYNMNHDLINKYTIFSAAGACDNEEEIPDLILAGKLVVWWRVLDVVEILGQTFVPMNDTTSYIKTYVLPQDDRFQRSIELIPKYTVDSQQTKKWNIFMAVYDYTQHSLDTLHYGIFNCIFNELFDISRTDEVIKAIKSNYSFLHS